MSCQMDELAPLASLDKEIAYEVYYLTMPDVFDLVNKPFAEVTEREKILAYLIGAFVTNDHHINTPCMLCKEIPKPRAGALLLVIPLELAEDGSKAACSHICEHCHHNDGYTKITDFLRQRGTLKVVADTPATIQ